MLIILYAVLKFASSNYINFTSFSAVFFTQPLDTNSSFNLQVQLYNSDSTKAKNSQVPVTLSLFPYSPLSGNLTVNTDDQGTATFSSVFSVYTGNFRLLAIASSYSSYLSDTFQITSGNNPFKKLIITPYETNINSFLFVNYFDVSAYDESGSLMQLPCIFEISVNNELLYSVLSYGFYEFNFYSTSALSFKYNANIYATCKSISTSLQIEYHPVMLVLQDITIVFSIQPPYTNYPFNLVIGVYDSTGKYPLNYQVLFDMKLYLLPSSTFLGSLQSKSGVFNFTGLMITTPGTYQIMANFSMTSAIMTSNFVVLPALNSMSLKSSNSNPGVRFQFIITVYLYDSNNNYFNGIETVTLNALEFGNVYSLSSNGIATFKVSFNNTGLKTIKVYCLKNSTSLDVNIAQNIIKIRDFNPVNYN